MGTELRVSASRERDLRSEDTDLLEITFRRSDDLRECLVCEGTIVLGYDEIGLLYTGHFSDGGLHAWDRGALVVVPLAVPGGMLDARPNQKRSCAALPEVRIHRHDQPV